jgi:hypothetical protein
VLPNGLGLLEGASSPLGPHEAGHAEAFLRERPDRARCTNERERAALRSTIVEAASRADYKVLKALYAWLVDEVASESRS